MAGLLGARFGFLENLTDSSKVVQSLLRSRNIKMIKSPVNLRLFSGAVL